MTAATVVQSADSWGMHGDVGAGWWVIMMLGMVLFWGAIILGVVLMIRAGSRGWWGRAEGPVSKETPVEILERRFAEGTISADDYRARREVLVGGSVPPSPPEEPSRQS